LCAALCLAAWSAAHAQWAGWDYEYDREKTSWKELQAQIPPYPSLDKLLPFEGGGASPHHFYVDPASISIGEDGVVRYTLVVRTAGGATNVSFEGMRCETRERKMYAIGLGRDRAWERARDPKWRRIEYREVNQQYGVLYKDFFCRNKQPMASVDDIVRLLKYPPEPSNTE
jgi:hypothetical protein